MSITTVRISPPKPPKSRRAKTASSRKDSERFFRTYRTAIIPAGAASWTLLITILIADNPARYWWLLLAVSTAAGLVWWKGHMFGAIRPEERAYAYVVASVPPLWATYATFGDSWVTAHDLAALVALTVITAGPWWRHRRIRDSVLVTFEDMSRRERDSRLKETRRLTNGWTAYTSAGHIQGARLRGIIFNQWSVGVSVRLRNGAHAAELQRASRRAHLESASYWPVRPGSVRIQADLHDARNCVIRYMMKDPHANPIIPDETELPTIESLIIGIFETGADVLFSLVNTLIAGETGAGKSMLVNRIIQLLSKIETIAMLGVDLTPSATELGPWRGVLHTLTSGADDTSQLFDAIIDEMYRRGRIMEQNGWKTFRCTKTDPFMVLIIDEARNVKAMKLNGKLIKICAEIRKYGGCVIIATQYPKNTSLDSDIVINLPQKIALKVFTETADRVIFGGSATRLGWSPSVLIPDNRKGSFLIKSENYSRPVLARGHKVDEDMVQREAAVWSPQRTSIPSLNLRQVETVEQMNSVPAGTLLMLEDDDGEEQTDIVEAVIVDEVEELILDMIDRGVNTPTAIRRELDSEFSKTVTVRTVNRHLKSLNERELIVQHRKQGPWFRKAN